MRLSLIAAVVLLASGSDVVMAGAVREFSNCSECAEAVTAITDYIVTHKHWREMDYRIEKRSEQNDYWMYEVVYLPEERNPHRDSRRGESFWIYYDPATRKIIKVFSAQ